jgi:hypothetical protein
MLKRSSSAFLCDLEMVARPTLNPSSCSGLFEESRLQSSGGRSISFIVSRVQCCRRWSSERLASKLKYFCRISSARKASSRDGESVEGSPSLEPVLLCSSDDVNGGVF